MEKQKRLVVFRHQGRASRRSCTGALAAMSYQPSAFARNWWRRKRNSAPRTATSTPAKYSVSQGNRMGCTGRLRMANRRAPSGRSLPRPFPTATQKLKPGLPTRSRGHLLPDGDPTGEQGPGARRNYIVNGKLIEGFAIAAYPAEYRSSGVKTFMVGSDGIVYEKDLGAKTNVVAGTMKEYNPNFQLARGGRPAGRNCGRAKDQRLAVYSDPGGEPLIKCFDRTFRNCSSTERLRQNTGECSSAMVKNVPFAHNCPKMQGLFPGICVFSLRVIAAK